MKKILPVGTKLRAIRPIYNPHTQQEYPAGTIFEVVGKGIDNQFGFYHLCPIGQLDDITMYNIEGSFEIKGE